MFQCGLPNIGPGAVAARETTAGGAGSAGGAGLDSALLGPATDFYKKLALDCSGQQVRSPWFSLVLSCG